MARPSSPPIERSVTPVWWQQVTGAAIYGPLKGERLRFVAHDELTFATWKNELPTAEAGRVLRPDERVAARYAPANWEDRMVDAPVVTPAEQKGNGQGVDAFAPRVLVVGIELDGHAKAYPLTALPGQSPIMDTIGGVPVMIVLGDDHKSVRAFVREIDGHALELYRRPDAPSFTLVDAETGSEWDFTGTARVGQLAGRELKQLPVLLDYWFDWKSYHPQTQIYRASEPRL